VQAQLVGVLINQRKRYARGLRRVLSDNQRLRDQADYRAELVGATQDLRALRHSRLFVVAPVHSARSIFASVLRRGGFSARLNGSSEALF
jgi:hypothetical protein